MAQQDQFGSLGREIVAAIVRQGAIAVYADDIGSGMNTITGADPGNYSQTNTFGTSIAAHASCTITVTFAPTATGSRTATLSIADSGGGSPQKLGLTGTGI
jgi:NAD(P)H-hydrate repair Nnr-like enzyme with NAD(P)H-hydrate epimerase domain